jgi:hypothetical protein
MGAVDPYETASGKRYRVQYRTPDRRNTMKRGFTTKRAAELFLASVEIAKVKGEWVDRIKDRTPVTEMAEAWFHAQVQVSRRHGPATDSILTSTSFHGGETPGWSMFGTETCRHGSVSFPRAWVLRRSDRSISCWLASSAKRSATAA